MSDNAISFEDGRRLLDKLLSEQIPIYAMLVLPTRTTCRVTGRVAGITRDPGLLISVDRPPSKGSATLAVPFFDRECEFTVRDLPENKRAEISADFGDTILCLNFPDADEFLILVFNSLNR